jgi:hypothetical protein
MRDRGEDRGRCERVEVVVARRERTVEKARHDTARCLSRQVSASQIHVARTQHEPRFLEQTRSRIASLVSTFSPAKNFLTFLKMAGFVIFF